MPKPINDAPSDPGAVVDVRSLDAAPKPSKKPETKAEKQPEKPAERFSVADLVAMAGERFYQRNPHPGRWRTSARHAVAETLHGWREHQHHTGGPMRLTLDDYQAALEAANKPLRCPEPHRPALSPHHPHKGAPWARGD